MEINGVTLSLGLVVSFSTRSEVDSNVYTGEIVGIDVSYAIARGYGDLVSYHEQVPAVGEIEKPSVDTLPFIIVQLADGSIRAFAVWWLDDATFIAVSEVDDITIRVRNVPPDKVALVLNYIRSMGYSCSQL